MKLDEIVLPSAKLTSFKKGNKLKNVPRHIEGDFYCSHDDLASLKGAPNVVTGDFNCTGNNISSLDGLNITCGESFYGGLNPITSLHNVHLHIVEAQFIGFSECPIKTCVLGLFKIRKLKEVFIGYPRDIPDTDNFPLARVRRIVNKHLIEGDIFSCQEELEDAGLEEFAKL